MSNITADDVALYDRQIRLWGLDGQQRMHHASVLLIGIKGLLVEVAKNLSLVGVGSITLWDGNIVTEEDLDASPMFRLSDVQQSKTRSDSAMGHLRELNPRVKFRSLSKRFRPELKSEAIENEIMKHTVVIVSSCFNEESLIWLNEICRKHHVKFYFGGTSGFRGFFFCDLEKHTYVEERKYNVGDETFTEKTEKVEHFNKLSTALNLTIHKGMTLKSLKKKIPPLFFAVLLLFRFLKEKGTILNKDLMLGKLDELRHRVLAQELGIDEGVVSVTLLENFVSNLGIEIIPVCSIVGGILAQEVIKVLTGKELPINNFFFYDGFDGSGRVFESK